MKISEFYDAGADIYQKQCSTIYFIKDKIDEYMNNIPEGSLVGDFGCGPGNEVKAHSDRLNFVGVDFSERMLAIYQESVSNAEIVHSDLRNINLPNAYLDSGICLFSLNHEDASLAIDGLSEIKRVIKSFGKILICIGAGQDQAVNAILSGFDAIPNIEPIPFFLWSKDNLLQLLEGQGFSITKFVEDHLFQHRSKYFWIEAICMPSDDSISERLPNSWRAKKLSESLLHIQDQIEYSGISRTAKLNNLINLDLPIYSVARPNSKIHITVASGKGVTEEEALASAHFEAFEIATSELKASPRLQKSLCEIRQLDLSYIEPEKLGQYGFPEGLVCDWLYMKDIEDSRDFLVPAALIQMSTEKEPFKSHGNGLSSGNTFYESVLHGILEVCERHAHTWALVLKQAYSVRDYKQDLDERVQNVLTQLEEQNISIEVNDISRHVGLPTYYVVTHNQFLSNIKGYNSGFGCHLDRRIALTRAITEAIQSLAGTVSGAREDLAAKQFEHSEKSLSFMDFWSKGSGKPCLDFQRTHPIPQVKGLRDAVSLTLFKARAADPRLGRCLVYTYPTRSSAIHVTRVAIEGAECFGLNRDSLGGDMYRFMKDRAGGK